jgi:hypothetical protein
MFAETEWKEFTSSEGNFRVVFPETPQQQKGTERNRHRFSAAAGDESYGLTYADYPPGTDWERVVNSERDSIVNGLGGSVVDEKRTSVEGYPGKWIRFVGQNTSGELAIYFVGHRLYVAARFCSEAHASAGEFFYISELVSSVIKAEGVAGYR